MYGCNFSLIFGFVYGASRTYDIHAGITAGMSSEYNRIFQTVLETNLSPMMFSGRVARLGKTLTRFSRNPN